MKPNSNVKHPNRMIEGCKEEQNKLVKFNDVALEWIANHVLGSILLFDIALVVPLLSLEAPAWVAAIVLILSSTWIQLWALPALQRTQVKGDVLRQTKADTDHEALTHIANQIDEIHKKVVE
jgi:hypothetical protein